MCINEKATGGAILLPVVYELLRSSTTLCLETPRGSHQLPPPPAPAKVAKHRLRARVIHCKWRFVDSIQGSSALIDHVAILSCCCCGSLVAQLMQNISSFFCYHAIQKQRELFA